MEKGPKRIGEILVEKGWITEAQLHDALLEQKLSDKFLGTILINKGLISDHNLMEALSVQFQIPIANLKTQYIDMELARKFSSSLILDHKCFPIYGDEDSITVAIINPLNAVAISKVEEEARPRKVNLVLTNEEDLQEVIKNYRQYISQSIQRLLRKDKPQQ
jgi:type IV pilus assembly protein PilB